MRASNCKDREDGELGKRRFVSGQRKKEKRYRKQNR